MYEEVYAEMVAGGIAAKLDTPVWLDKTGQIVESEEEAFGMKTQYILTHPQKSWLIKLGAIPHKQKMAIVGVRST